MKLTIKSAIFLAVFFSAVGCKKNNDDNETSDTAETESAAGEDDDDSTKASFTVQLNSTGASLLGLATSLTAKLGGVDLIADCAGDAPPGNCLELGLTPDPDIWINEGCNDDIAKCTTSNTEFFELIDVDAANTILNSQGRSISPGTFTKVRIYFLNNDAADALQCDNVSSSVKPGVPITVTLLEKTVVAAGESVTVTLNYDPSAVDCSDDATISSTFNAMTATVTKN